MQLLGCDMAADRNETRVTEAIEKLWSADDEERLLGKNELLCLGGESADRLVAFLENLVRNPKGVGINQGCSCPACS